MLRLVIVGVTPSLVERIIICTYRLSVVLTVERNNTGVSTLSCSLYSVSSVSPAHISIVHCSGMIAVISKVTSTVVPAR